MSNTESVYPFNGYAPGNYENTCAVCKKNTRNVDKLCFICLECAIKVSREAVPGNSGDATIPKNTEIVEQSFKHEIEQKNNPNKYPVSSFSFRQGAFWLKEQIAAPLPADKVHTESPEEQDEMWYDVVDIYKDEHSDKSAVEKLKQSFTITRKQ